MKTALYSGSFDPVTYGHLDVIDRGARAFDRLVIAIGIHHAKKALFSPDQRLAMLTELIEPIAARHGCRIEVTRFEGLVVDAARDCGASVILRGLRNVTDFDYEHQMAGMNAALAPEIDTLYLAAAPAVSHIASSLVRQVAAVGGDIGAFVPPLVATKLTEALRSA